MSHPAELSLAMHADDALEAHEAAAMEQHLATCERLLRPRCSAARGVAA